MALNSNDATEAINYTYHDVVILEHALAYRYAEITGIIIDLKDTLAKIEKPRSIPALMCLSLIEQYGYQQQEIDEQMFQLAQLFTQHQRNWTKDKQFVPKSEC